MSLSIIVAHDSNNGIGKNNDIPWYIPEDFKWFKEKTINKTVVMGSKTYLSLPSNVRPLPNRVNYVLCKWCTGIDGDVNIFNTKEAVLEYSKSNDVFIIGGGSIYNLFIDDIDKLYVTTIDRDFNCDTFFPNINNDEWVDEYTSDIKTQDSLNYKFNIKIRK